MTKQELKTKTNGVILDVLITEKGSALSTQNRYLLEVARDARKPQAMAEQLVAADHKRPADADAEGIRHPQRDDSHSPARQHHSAGSSGGS